MKSDVRVVVVTDLDGTLLDHDTYSFRAALSAIDLILREGVPLVVCSSKTRAEIELLQQELAIRHPFISENGGALFVPDGYFPFDVTGTRRVDHYEVIEFGRPYGDLVAALRAAAARVRVAVSGFSDMSAEEIARVCRLPLFMAKLAKQREYDEPFRVSDRKARRRLVAALRESGLACVRGGRFDHVTGWTDKGRAIGQLRELYERDYDGVVVLVGLGDSLNDLSLLRAVDIPVIVRNRATDAARLLSRVPTARVTAHPGPSGWSEAVCQVVRAVLRFPERALG